ncbi:MAG: AAA family ATPase [Candidatus Sumerlaeota bacterium]|nr:AAA family ATPase [Candidatus Sumerlaeota bacterium]
MFTRLKVTGYKCLADVDLRLCPLNVLIGPNGAGKSTVIDVFLLLFEAAQGKIGDGLARRGGIERVITSLPGRSPDHFCFLLAHDVKEPLIHPPAIGEIGSLEYDLKVKLIPPRSFDLEERLLAVSANDPNRKESIIEKDTSKPERLPSGGLSVSFQSETILSQNRVFGDAAFLMSTYLLGMRYFGALDISPRAPIRVPQRLEPAKRFPAPTGEDLISVLYDLRTDHEEAYQRIEEAVQTGFEDFLGFEFPVVAGGMATMLWKSRTHSGYPNELSEGMLRYLMLATMLLSPAPPPLICLDEPEVSLHPVLLMLLAGLLQEASTKTQVLVATHSDQLIRWLEPQDLVIMDLENGMVSVKRGDDPSLSIQKWLESFTLNELWLMGELGGRP